MATGRTISANSLTKEDEKIIKLCEKISLYIENEIKDDDLKQVFRNEYGKISFTRDGGAGRGAGKLQRDALCTRGMQGKAPYSNRNLRWHPLVIATTKHKYAKPIERIEIEGEDDAQTLFFVVNINGKEKRYPSEKVHELPERFITLPSHWNEHIEIIRHWNDVLWTGNSCIIPAYEACDWQNAVEAYAVLAISVAVNFFGLSFSKIYNSITEILKNQTIDKSIELPSKYFPKNKADIICCPLCKVPVADKPANLPEKNREDRYKFSFNGSKRSEGEDGSMQIMHVNPLIEKELLHCGNNVRYGHRWCNVAMTDHSIEETVDFMEYIVKIAHRR